MQKRIRFMIVLLLLINGFNSPLIWAQDFDEIVDAILKLPRTNVGNQQIVTGQLYSGKVDAIITDSDGIFDNFEDGDTINFKIESSRDRDPLSFPGTRTDFDQFVRDNVDELLEILFPTSISEGLTGTDAPRNHSQQFVDNVLEQRIQRSNVGGLVEYERFDVDDISGTAYQGIFYIEPISSSLSLRYTTLDDDIETRSFALSWDTHPFIEGESEPWVWSVGLDGFITAVKAQANALDLGVLDFGGGIWGSLQRFLGENLFIGGGVLLQVSQTHIPSFFVPDYDDIELLVDSINKQKADFNITYGGIIGRKMSDSVGVNAKLIQNHIFSRTAGQKTTSQTIFLAGPTFYTGDFTYIDVGLKTAVGLKGVKANSIFLQGNYRW